MLRPPSSIFLRNQSAVYVPNHLLDWSPTPILAKVNGTVSVILACSAAGSRNCVYNRLSLPVYPHVRHLPYHTTHSPANMGRYNYLSPLPTSTLSFSLHSQDTVPKTQKKYSQKWNCPRYMNVEI
jgi:hypothetical protein